MHPVGPGDEKKIIRFDHFPSCFVRDVYLYTEGEIMPRKINDCRPDENDYLLSKGALIMSRIRMHLKESSFHGGGTWQY